MSTLSARKVTWDNMADEAKAAIKVADDFLTLGEPAVWKNPQNQDHYIWDDSRIGTGQSWIDEAPPGLFTVLEGFPEGWKPV